jgi:hypothetical protein
MLYYIRHYTYRGDRGSTGVKVLRYKSEGRWFIDINPSDRTMALGSTQKHEMNYRMFLK